MNWYDKEKTKQIQSKLIQELLSYNPSYFLTIQFPNHYRKSQLRRSECTLKHILRHFERHLIGRRWNNKPVPFIAFAEHNMIEGWHFHILFYDCDYDNQRVDIALNKTVKQLNLPKYTCDLQKITTTPEKVCSYCVKTIKSDSSGRFDTDVIIPYTGLFDLKEDKSGKINQETKKTKIIISNKQKRKAEHIARLFKRFTLLPLFAGFLYLRLSLFPLRPRPAAYLFGDIGYIPHQQYQHC